MRVLAAGERATWLRQVWRGRDVAVIYAALVVAVTAAVSLMPEPWARGFVLDASTNLVNLQRHPAYALLMSAFVQSSPIELVMVPALIWAYGALQHWLGRTMTITVAIVGHVGATLVVAKILAAAIVAGAVSASAAHAVDVGASYGLAAAAGLLTARIPRRWAPLYAGLISAILAVAVVMGHSFTDVGHGVAWLIGIGLALLVTTARLRRTRVGRTAT